VIVDPLHALFVQAREGHQFRDTVVTLLLDNSGSMRGGRSLSRRPAPTSSRRTLERCGVKVEILGSPPAPGRAANRANPGWRPQAGHPGRLTIAPHHLQSRPTRVAARAQESRADDARRLLKENIDGERSTGRISACWRAPSSAGS